MDAHWIPPSSHYAIRQNRASTDSPSPSPSRSPHKRQTATAKFLDPFHSQINFTTALEAFEAPHPADHSSQDEFYHSIATATHAERALAIRAASAGKQVEEWHEEVQRWQWPDACNGFEPPGRQSLSSNREEPQIAEQNSRSSRDGNNGNVPGHEYWGSLQAQTVIDHQKRIDEIRDAIDALELNELKAYVRDAHLASMPRQAAMVDSSDYDINMSTYTSLGQFTAFVTTIIMQSLPVMFGLETLLGCWEVRLDVLRMVPGFIKIMDKTHQEMVAAWRALDKSPDGKRDLDNLYRMRGTDTDGSLTRPFILGLKERLESQIRDLGQRLDYMLDTLEGSQDTIPDVWIDNMEQLEADFGNWVVEAEKIVVVWELDTEENLSRRHAGVEGGHADLPTTGPSTQNGIRATSAQEASMQEHDKQDSDRATSTLEVPNDVGHRNDRNLRINNKPLPLNLQHRRNHSNALSDLSSESSFPGSATSDYFSNVSSPEIQDASRAEYFEAGSPVEVSTPGFARRESKESDPTVSRQSSQRTERGDFSLPAVTSPARSRASTVLAEPTIHEDGSFANVTRKDVGRSLPTTESQNALHDTEVVLNLKNSSPTSPIPAKSQHRFETFTDLSPGNTPVKVFRRKTADGTNVPAMPRADVGRPVPASPTKSTDNDLENRISSILTEIPANIRLARGRDGNPGKTAQSPASRPAKLIKKSSKPRFVRSQTAAPSPPTMTLTPANEKATTPQNGEPEIKLYHLHQSGKEVPVKLFIRLVGESGERVMVRIGGGWADLAEYLKEYAIHHGQRTVSDGKFDIQGLPSSQSSSLVTTLGSLSNTQTPRSISDSPNGERSASGAILRNRRLSTGMASSPSTPGVLQDSRKDIRPTSRDSNASSKRSWLGDDSPSLGLAGPKGKKAVVSPNKQAWVETMVEKARVGSSEKKKATRSAFGDLGIMGGTKRLFMKKDMGM